MEELDEKVGSRLILRYQSGHLGVNGLTQCLEQGEVAARIYKPEILCQPWEHFVL